ncbi:hypothetical protein [Thalassotalea sp. G2M2-11]|uniref:hypothetical protein n=1 Tax=Thalassotalea sp. G2M2-11 TaxID=2787627 RepID=UPI0019CFC050|nr:hypothetical protein [Thalassotalea sp. G2M2-11]
MSIIILIVLLSQIWFLSYFYPTQVVRRIDYVLSHCPEKEYPKLYPISVERIKTIKICYQYANYLFIILGLMMISYFTLIVPDYNDHLNILDDLPLLFGLAQMLPLFLLEILSCKHLKLMREQHHQNNRKAELQPRRLFNYVSPVSVAVAVFTYIVFIGFELYLSGLTLTTDVAIKIATVTGVNILFIILVMANLYGKKRDPYQTNAQRHKQTQFVIHSMVFVSIFMTLYIIAHSWVNAYQFNLAEIIINSLYFQVIALFSIGTLLGRFKIEDINFDVYRAEKTSAS